MGEWISVKDRLPPEFENVECLNWDDSIFVDCLTNRCVGRPTDYGYTPTEKCLPEGVEAWRPLMTYDDK